MGLDFAERIDLLSPIIFARSIGTASIGAVEDLAHLDDFSYPQKYEDVQSYQITWACGSRRGGR